MLFLVTCNYKPDKKQFLLHSGTKANNKLVVCKPVLVSDNLPKVVNEQSGMIWHNNLIWVNNDSGGDPALYAYNLKGILKHTIQVKNARNRDWEALAEDDKYFYIGDFGNNYGTRKNLKLYRINKSKLENNNGEKPEAEEIRFEWADQRKFIFIKQKHNFDCEAFFSYRDSLYFFTKNRENLKTRMYSMPKILKYHKLQAKSVYNADLLVTGADINSKGDVVALVGYKNFRTYMILFYDFAGVDFFNGKSIRLDLSALGSAQTEGVVFSDNEELYINTEATKQKQAIYRIEDWKQLILTQQN